MISRPLGALLASVALPLALLPLPVLARAPEVQNPETVVHKVSAPDAAEAAADLWPFAASDLELDPEYRIGVLDNGMRYIVRPNGTPAAQGMVYLWVDTGSMNEEDDQLGFAHFVEHMAFNGSRNVPEGEMIRLLEREGLAFGPDTNASTTFDRTIYQLNLPRNDTDLLETALMLMRETAGNLSFDAEAVQREIGVIQSERRVRDTYSLRNIRDMLEFLYPGSRFAARWIGGEDETIDAATATRLRDYYERWYRPDNAALIVIGDYDADQVEELVAQYFADWKPAADLANASGGPIDFARSGETDIFIDPALPESVTATRIGPWIARPDTIASREERVLRQIGYGIINRRLQSISRQSDAPYRAAAINTEEVFHDARATSLVVQTGEGEWKEGLLAAQEEYRRAMEAGFTEAEVAEQVANLRSAIATAAAGADTRSNASFIASALTLLQDEQVPTTPQSGLERFESYAPSITPEAVLAALKTDIVPLEDPLLRFTGKAAPGGGEAALRQAWDDGMAVELVAREEAAAAAFAYTDFGTPGTVVEDELEPLLGIRTIRFDNGVMLNLKRTDLQDDRIMVQVNIDGGEMLDTRADPLATAMFSSLIVGGLGEHPLDELTTILAGRQVGINLDADDETFELSGATTPGDLDMQLRLIAAAISDPAYRPDGEAQYRRSVANFFARRDATPESALSTREAAILSDNDPRYSLQPEADFMSLTFAGLREDVSDRLQNGAIEVALVGDFDEAKAIELVAQTLGALPPRESAFRPYEDNRQRSFTADRSPRVLRHTGADNQAILRMTWPTRDGEDLHESMKLELLQRVVRLELTDSLREELGQTYSPFVAADQSRVWPDWGTFSLGAALDPDDVDAARTAILETLESLRREPVDEDMLLRARAPALESFDNALKTNGGWMRYVDRAQSKPEDIARFTQGREILQAITPADLRDIARRYLDPEQRVEIEVLPAGA